MAASLLCCRADMHQFTLNKIHCFFLVAALAGLVVAGCGGSDSPAGGTNSRGEIVVETGSLSKAQFIKQADAICEKGRKQFERELGTLLRNGGEVQKSEENALAATLVETSFVPTYEKQIEQISSLGAPSGDEKEVAAFLNALQQVLDESKKEPLKFIRAEGRFANQFGKAAKLAEAYGFTYCPT